MGVRQASPETVGARMKGGGRGGDNGTGRDFYMKDTVVDHEEL